eukprot:jgi/Chlat1/6232/Chrsp44S05766
MGEEDGNSKQEVEKDKAKRVAVSIIAKPLAGKKLNKKALKIVKKAAKQKQLKRGVKEVVKALRKGQKGLCIIAGDISPIDVITHLPILCEELDVPYIYDLGTAGATKRPTSCMLILPAPLKPDLVTKEDQAKFSTELTELSKEVEELHSNLVFP